MVRAEQLLLLALLSEEIKHLELLLNPDIHLPVATTLRNHLTLAAPQATQSDQSDLKKQPCRRKRCRSVSRRR